ncbi:hypothetical protein [Microcoleus sp. SVA1_A1]|uniref:hypothetical protein n=1 Tax=Microcoleus sp. SVA1_A1 TaxID=2818946 RepID=UPI002FD22064
MIAPRLWQTSTQRGSSVDREAGRLAPYQSEIGLLDFARSRQAMFRIPVSETNPKQIRNKSGLGHCLLYGRKRPKPLMVLGFINGYGRT